MHGENPGRMAPLTAFNSFNELIFIKHKAPQSENREALCRVCVQNI